MMTESDGEREQAMMERPGPSSEMVRMDDNMMAVASRPGVSPSISQLNVTKSTKVHIGPQFVSVTQNVRNTEVIKELPFPRYIWNVLKNTSRTERLSCAAAMSALVICLTLILYFTIAVKNNNEDENDVAPHSWNITREMWLALPANNSLRTTDFEPLRLVIVQHTVSQDCFKFINCAAELRTLQSYYQRNLGYDIPYNFMIGNDGRVYEGRGWGRVGAHTYMYNSCSLGVGFVGDYREELPVYNQVTELQMKRFSMLLEEGVRRGILRPNYHIVGAKDLRATASPGSNLYRALQQLEHFDHQGLYRNRSCAEIRDMPQPTR